MLVHATVVGRFFAGKQIHYPKGTFWGGYGHMGCCSLLAIQQIITIDPHDRKDLDYAASIDQPDIDKAGCGFRQLTPIDSSAGLINAQKAAESGQNEWVFEDPLRVAKAALARYAQIDEESVSGIHETKRSQARLVYRWAPDKKHAYMIVVSKPYMLSFYANDSQRVAWVVSAAYLSSCDGPNSVIRIK